MEEAAVALPELGEWTKSQWLNTTPEEFLALYPSAAEAKEALLRCWEGKKMNGQRGSRARAILDYLEDCISRRDANKKMGKTALIAGATVGTPVLAGVAAALRWRSKRKHDVERREVMPDFLPYVLKAFEEIYQKQKTTIPGYNYAFMREENLAKEMMKLYQDLTKNFRSEIPKSIHKPGKGSKVPNFLEDLFAYYGYFIEFQITEEVPGFRCFSAMCFEMENRDLDQDAFDVDLSRYINEIPILKRAEGIGYIQEAFRVKQPALLRHFRYGPEALSSPTLGGTFTLGGHILIFPEALRKTEISETQAIVDESAHAISGRLIPQELLLGSTRPFVLAFDPNELVDGTFDRTATAQMGTEEDVSESQLRVLFPSVHDMDEVFSIAFRNVFAQANIMNSVDLLMNQQSNKEGYAAAENFFTPYMHFI